MLIVVAYALHVYCVYQCSGSGGKDLELEIEYDCMSYVRSYWISRYLNHLNWNSFLSRSSSSLLLFWCARAVTACPSHIFRRYADRKNRQALHLVWCARRQPLWMSKIVTIIWLAQFNLMRHFFYRLIRLQPKRPWREWEKLVFQASIDNRRQRRRRWWCDDDDDGVVGLLLIETVDLLVSLHYLFIDFFP